MDDIQEIYFMQGFDKALSEELSEPSDDFIKAVFNRMDGKRMTDTIKDKIKSLINSSSIQNR